MLSIRFSRKGKKKAPLYSVIITDKTKDPWGDYIEKLGTYNPHTKEAVLNNEAIISWIGKGAQPTASVHNLLVNKGVIKADKVRAGKTKPGKKKSAQIESAAKAKAAAIEAAAKEEEAKAKAAAEAEAASQAVQQPAAEAVAATPETAAEAEPAPATETKSE